MDLKSPVDVGELVDHHHHQKSEIDTKLEETQSISSSSSPNDVSEGAKSSGSEQFDATQLNEFLQQQLESQNQHLKQQLVSALLNQNVQNNSNLLAAVMAAANKGNPGQSSIPSPQKWQPNMAQISPAAASVWQNALNAATQSPASSSSSASSTSNTPQPVQKTQKLPQKSASKTPNINMTSAALLTSLAASNNSIGSTMQQALNSLYSPQQLLKSASANLASPSLSKSQSGSQRSLLNSNIYNLQNAGANSSSSSSPTASLHNLTQSTSINSGLLSSVNHQSNINLLDDNLSQTNNVSNVNALQAALATLNLNNSTNQINQSQPQQSNVDLSSLLNNQILLDIIRQDPSQLENILKLKNLVQISDENTGASTSTGLVGNLNQSGSNGNLIDELQQQLDQTVPANLVAAAVAAAANQQQFQQTNAQNFLLQQQQQQQQRNSPRPNLTNPQQLLNSNQFQPNFTNLTNQFNLQALKQQLNQNLQQQFFTNPNQTLNLNQLAQHQSALQLLQNSNLNSQFPDYNEERFSRKVFVGGLPPDIDEDEIVTHFRRYGNLIVDWPHKAESKSYFPPKGYAFLIFQEERSVQELIEQCVMDDGKLYMVVSSPSMKDKPVQIRPWCLADSDFVMDGSQPLDPRKTIFVGGVPRPLKAVELAMIMDRFYGGVCYAGIDTDPELKYPKGAGRVAFSNQQSYIAAISARFVQLQHGEIDKRVEVKPYVLDDQMCDECQGVRCGGKFAPFFCANVTCLQYYCEACWATIHTRPGREYHKPLVKEGADRPRPLPYK
ncbi:unnamed protein product [Brachionus calyciflorus]|uniref:RRM domain-containing protein n=1 Tax=Brachionus calyciflorus TaxID=104777 RepID=A0A814FS76_9BILA|nr:unnamed protein product [Brachionus calyciflorus]